MESKLTENGKIENKPYRKYYMALQYKTSDTGSPMFRCKFCKSDKAGQAGNNGMGNLIAHLKVHSCVLLQTGFVIDLSTCDGPAPPELPPEVPPELDATNSPGHSSKINSKSPASRKPFLNRNLPLKSRPKKTELLMNVVNYEQVTDSPVPSSNIHSQISDFHNPLILRLKKLPPIHKNALTQTNEESLIGQKRLGSEESPLSFDDQASSPKRLRSEVRKSKAKNPLYVQPKTQQINITQPNSNTSPWPRMPIETDVSSQLDGTPLKWDYVIEEEEFNGSIIKQMDVNRLAINRSKIFHPTKEELDSDKFYHYAQNCGRISAGSAGAFKVERPLGCELEDIKIDIDFDKVEIKHIKQETTTLRKNSNNNQVFIKHEKDDPDKWTLQQFNDHAIRNGPPENVKTLNDADIEFWKMQPNSDPILYASSVEPPPSYAAKSHLNQFHSYLNHVELKGFGVTQSFLYFGMWASSFVAHVEDARLGSISFLRFGAPKVWYVISPAHAKLFEWYVKNKWYIKECENCPNFLQHKMAFVHPELLREVGIPFAIIIQMPGEYVVTLPGGYHFGYNLGFNCAEAVNFGPESWFEVLPKTDEEYCSCNYLTKAQKDKQYRVDVDKLKIELERNGIYGLLQIYQICKKI